MNSKQLDTSNVKELTFKKTVRVTTSKGDVTLEAEGNIWRAYDEGRWDSDSIMRKSIDLREMVNAILASELASMGLVHQRTITDEEKAQLRNFGVSS